MNLQKTIREELADLEHQQWIEWTRYMLNNLTPEKIKQWKILIDTPYCLLTDEQKWSDRRWADKVIKLVSQTMTISKTK